MKINIADIIKIQGATKEVTVSKRNMVIPDDFYSMELCEPIELVGELESDNGMINLTGVLKAKVKTICYRCTCDMIYNIESEVAESFGSDVQSIIDLEPIMVETLLISLPMKSLCDEDCKGMCAVCGQNLNKQSCDCDLEYLDPRLEKLDLLFGETGQDENNKEV